MKRIASLAIVLAIIVCGNHARAQTSVAVLGIEANNAPTNMASLLTVSLKNQVNTTAGFKLIPGKDLDEIKLVFGCVDEKPACMARAGKSLQASKLIWGSVKKTSSGYNVTLKWLDVPKGRIEKFVSENVGRKPLNQSGATRAIKKLTSSFLVSTSGTIKITSNVTGAQVMIGPRVIGLTDSAPLVLRDVAAGTLLIRISRDGYQIWTQQVVVRGGQTTELNASLTPVDAKGPDGGKKPPFTDPPPDDPTQGGSGWKIAFWTSAAATVGLAVGMGVTGYTVLNLEEEKENAILAYQDKYLASNPGSKDKPMGTGDACSQADNYPDATAVKDACESGKTRAIITNVLLGTMLAAAALSGFFYYKAYIDDEAPAPSPDKDPDDDEEAATREAPSVRWMVSPTAGPDGAGVGFSLNF